MRTITEPAKWPITDSASAAAAVVMIPPPPLIHQFTSLPSFVPNSQILEPNNFTSQYDNLNPNVPEFVPVSLAVGNEGDISEAEEVVENSQG